MPIHSDRKIHEAVVRELAQDPRVDGNTIGVVVEDHVVTLKGRARTWTAKLIAQEVAHRVQGVLDVANDIEVSHHTPRFHDGDIAHTVRAHLTTLAGVPHERITTTVSDGIVTLLGSVDSERQREEVVGQVRDLEGVHMVVDELAVTGPGVDERELRASIAAALQRHATREADKLTIEIDGDRVALRGKVGSWAERTAIAGIIRGMRGVSVIDDHLEVVE